MRTLLVRFYAVLSSRRFFQAILAFFIFEAAWIALSAVYPMAFDEDFHFGLLKVYSHHWLPFLTSQPDDAAAFGAVTRDPSYLYHYLMSFPYRLIALFIHGQTGQVITLRFINIGLFSYGLVLFRKALLRAKLSNALSNIILLLFALIPIAPQLAAHINYDNLLFPIVAIVCLLSFRLIDQLKSHKISSKTVLSLVAICTFASLVKYAFLPIYLGVAVFFIVAARHAFGGKFGKVWAILWKDWRNQSRIVQIGLVIICLVGIGMFFQRDVYNLVKYHSIVPACDQVLSKQTCSDYPVWYFTYNSHQIVATAKHQQVAIEHYNPITYLGVWVYWMWYRLFFAINGPSSGFVNYPPLPLPSAAAALLAIVGLIMVLVWRRKLFAGDPYLTLFLVISLSYVTTLLADGYTAYRYTNVLQTMNGRYLLPILILVAAIIGRAFSLELHSSRSKKTALAIIVLLLFLQGGGLLTFIARSDASWDWPNATVVKINNAARKVVDHTVIEGSKTYSTHVWVFN